MIAAVDDRDIGTDALQIPRCGQPAETSAHDDDVTSRIRGWRRRLDFAVTLDDAIHGAGSPSAGETRIRGRVRRAQPQLATAARLTRTLPRKNIRFVATVWEEESAPPSFGA